MNTLDIARELVLGEIEIIDLIKDKDFLLSIDQSLKQLVDTGDYGQHIIASKRKQLSKVIESI